jgi:hypothetical protein
MESATCASAADLRVGRPPLTGTGGCNEQYIKTIYTGVDIDPQRVLN